MRTLFSLLLCCTFAGAVVVPGPGGSQSCYQNGVAGQITRADFNKDGTTWIWVCDGQQTSATDSQHCVSAQVPPNFNGMTLVNNPCIVQPHMLDLPGTMKLVSLKRQQECGQ